MTAAILVARFAAIPCCIATCVCFATGAKLFATYRVVRRSIVDPLHLPRQGGLNIGNNSGIPH